MHFSVHAESRIPARLLLRSPWFVSNEIGDLYSAVYVVKDYFVSADAKSKHY
jgi:hypothetical protein